MKANTLSLNLTADKLNYLPQEGKIRLAGVVRLRAGQLRIQGRSMVVSLDKGKRPIRVEVESVVLVHKGLGNGEARRGVLDLRGQHIWLSGDANLAMKRTGLRLQGQRIFLDLRTSKLVVHKARATLASEPDTTKGSASGS